VNEPIKATIRGFLSRFVIQNQSRLMSVDQPNNKLAYLPMEPAFRESNVQSHYKIPRTATYKLFFWDEGIKPCYGV